MINTKKLSKELIAAGVTHGGVNADGIVWDADGTMEIQARSDVAAIIAAHDPSRTVTLSPSQQIILSNGEDAAKVVVTGEPGATVDCTINGVAFQAMLDQSGSETIELICDTPNTTLVVQAETAKAVIYVVEVPS